jgi:peptide/nickel transport system substrate-binding protein
LVILGCLATACLAADPEREAQVRAEASSTKTDVATTTAPPSLDPAILETRMFGESPSMAARVAIDDLPPVSERLPDNPKVIVPLEEIGQYGGKLRRALTGDIVQTPGVDKTLRASLMGYSRPLPKSIEPMIAESFRLEEEGRVAIFNLRKGIRWSDGVPFTVDDILFWYYDMNLNDDARASALPGRIWFVDDIPVQMEKVDDYTLRVSSHKPMGRILNAFAGGAVAQPKHILSKIHPKYNPDATYQTFRDSTTGAQLLYNAKIPTLSTWMPVRWDRGQRVLFERNPYFWQVDSAGNQLPYADAIEFNVVQDTQVILLKFVNGEIDLFGRYSRIDMFPTLKSEERKGKFKLYLSGPTSGPAFYLNWDSPKPNVRTAFRDLRVRKALSHAMNREEINEILFFGLMQEVGYSFGPLSPLFSEEKAKMYTAYDPGLARLLLAEAGYHDSDGDGYREYADGSRFEFNVDVTASVGSDVAEVVVEQWREVGLKMNLNVALRDILWPRRLNGEFDIHYWVHEGPAEPLVHIDDWAIVGENLPFWHRNATTEGQEWFHEVTRHVNAAVTTVDPDEFRKHMIRVRDLHTENVPVIIAGAPYHVWGASTRLGNVPTDLSPLDEHRGWSRPVFHEQIFIRQGNGEIGK